VNDMDMEVKHLFDERLGALAPPPRTERKPRRRLRVAAAAAIATFAFAGAGLVVDVNAVAATNGADCANFLTKVQLWAQSHRSDLTATDHSAAKADLARLVAASGCSPHGASHDSMHTGPHH
jgi:hypothetical protein